MLLSVTDFQEFGADGQCCISLISGEIRFGKKRNCINRFECKPALFASTQCSSVNATLSAGFGMITSFLRTAKY
jgi:hypothetical protein